jgi:hypothetical protein
VDKNSIIVKVGETEAVFSVLLLESSERDNNVWLNPKKQSPERIAGRD